MPRVVRAWLVLFGVALGGCDDTFGKRPESAPAGTSPVVSALPPVPPALEGTPVSAFADAAAPPPAGSERPHDQAVRYEASGQLWMARLVLEKTALSKEGTEQDALVLARVCAEQGDATCVAACEKKLGRKLRLDAGKADARAAAGPVESRAESDLAQAQRLVLQNEHEEARRILEPKLAAKTASREELRVLKAACERLGETVCALACDGLLAKKR